MPDLALFMPLCTLLDVTLNELFAGECIAEEKLKGKADLVGYIDTFMLKQRAKEFASYLLLGMEKRRLTRLFLYTYIKFFVHQSGISRKEVLCGCCPHPAFGIRLDISGNTANADGIRPGHS